MKKIRYFVLLISIFCVQAFVYADGDTSVSRLNAQQVVFRLNKSEIDPEKRILLLNRLKAFPSPHTMAITERISHIDPNKEVREAAELTSAHMRKFLYYWDLPVLRHTGLGKGFTLRQWEYELKVSAPPYRGNVKAFLRDYLLDQFLKFELIKLAGTRVSGSLYKAFQDEVIIPTEVELEKVIKDKINENQRIKERDKALVEEKKGRLLKKSGISNVVMRYYGEQILRNYLWQESLDQMGESIREQAYLQAKGLVYRHHRQTAFHSDNMPASEIARYYRRKKADFFEFIRKQMPSKLRVKGMRAFDAYFSSMDRFKYTSGRKKLPKKIRGFMDFLSEHMSDYVSHKTMDRYFKDNPEMRIFVERPQAVMQGVWFVYPSLHEYKQKDPERYEKAKKRITQFQNQVLSERRRLKVRADIEEIFDMDPKREAEALKTIKPRNVGEARAIRRRKDKIFVAVQIVGAPETAKVEKEEVLVAVDALFARASQILTEPKSKKFTPALALRNALGEAIGHTMMTLSGWHRHKVQLMTFILQYVKHGLFGRMREKMFNYLDGLRFSFEDVLKASLKDTDSPREKKIKFKKVVDEYRRLYSQEFIYIRPGLIRDSDGEDISPQVREWSMYGKNRKKPGETAVQYFVNNPEPSLRIYQWSYYRPMRFRSFEDDDGRGQSLQIAIRNIMARKFWVGVDRKILREYGEWTETFGNKQFTKIVRELSKGR